MKLTAVFIAAATAKNADKRFNKIRGHADTLLDLIDNNTTASDKNVERAEKWVNKVFDQAASIDVELCSDEIVEEVDDALVFNQDDFCKLTGQVGTALRSYVRKFGCDEALPKKNFMNTFAKRTNRMRNIFLRLGKCAM
ncbi:unnamed protein product [Oikopleura dioica]|uniref:Uncharacterized protein n=1 Tax=Oikopleura dioica TaxID=34765 RepID=E4Y9M3_OIKDI|nr:unnamed protein product [Oikopleura dioica]